jgi:hypothetical protein
MKKKVMQKQKNKDLPLGHFRSGYFPLSGKVKSLKTGRKPQA